MVDCIPARDGRESGGRESGVSLTLLAPQAIDTVSKVTRVQLLRKEATTPQTGIAESPIQDRQGTPFSPVNWEHQTMDGAIGFEHDLPCNISVWLQQNGDGDTGAESW